MLFISMYYYLEFVLGGLYEFAYRATFGSLTRICHIEPKAQKFINLYVIYFQWMISDLYKNISYVADRVIMVAELFLIFYVKHVRGN